MEIDFKNVMSKRSDNDLIIIVTTDRHKYKKEAIEIAEEEIKTRNIDQEKLQRARNRIKNISNKETKPSLSELNQKEKIKLNQVYKARKTQLYSIMAITAILLIVFSFVPVDFIAPKAKRSGITGNFINYTGIINTILYIIITLIIVSTICYFSLQLNKLKKDINEKMKIVANVMIWEIEELSQWQKKEGKKYGSNTTHSIKFEENIYKIKDYHFNKVIEPNLLEAKSLILNLASNSKVEVSREIIK